MAVQYLERTGKAKLAYVYSPATDEGKDYPLIMFMGGYRSDMNGTKATYLEKQCQERGQAFLRFDYSGHGQSEGNFEDGTIGSWLEDSLAVLDHIAPKSVVLVGSSMGGWVALLAARERAGIIDGLVGIAAAPDFTEEIYNERLNDEQRKALQEDGQIAVENDYSDEPYAFTKAFYEEAKTHLLLGEAQTADHPVRLIQGMQDQDVLWETAVKIQKSLKDADADIIFVEDGDHSLSRPEDLDLIDKEIKSICGYI